MTIIRTEAKNFNGMTEYTVVKDAIDVLNCYEPFKAVVRHIVNHNNKVIETDWTECCVLEIPQGNSVEEVIEKIKTILYLDGRKFKVLERS